ATGDGSNVTIQLSRFQDNNLSTQLNFVKSRGSVASPVNPITGDSLGLIAAFARIDGANRQAAQISFKLTDPSPSPTALGSQIVLSCAAASNTSLGTAAAFDRDNGIMVGGSTSEEVVVTASRHFKLRSYTVATLPSAAVVGQMIFVTDDVGGSTPAF